MHVLRFATRGHGMEAATSARGALAEAVGFLSYFRDLKDSRQPGKVSYPLDEILLLCLLAVLQQTAGRLRQGDGAPSTPCGAGIGRRRGWRPFGRHDDQDRSPLL